MGDQQLFVQLDQDMIQKTLQEIMLEQLYAVLPTESSPSKNDANMTEQQRKSLRRRSTSLPSMNIFRRASVKLATALHMQKESEEAAAVATSPRSSEKNTTTTTPPTPTTPTATPTASPSAKNRASRSLSLLVKKMGDAIKSVTNVHHHQQS